MARVTEDSRAPAFLITLDTSGMNVAIAAGVATPAIDARVALSARSPATTMTVLRWGPMSAQPRG
jgi:hypothetical protein